MTRNRNVEGLLFDLDGTLLDHDTAATTAFTAALTGVAGADVDHEAARRRWSELEHHAMDRYLAGELTFTGQRRLRVTTLFAELGLGSWDDTEADTWFAGYLRHYEAAWHAFPDVAPCLAVLAGQAVRPQLGVLTNGDAAQQRDKLRRIGLGTALPVLVASSEVGVAKPRAEIFHAACAVLGLPPGRVAYVGDRHDVDAAAANAAGLYGVWLNRAGAPVPAGLPAVRSLEELPALLGFGQPYGGAAG
ncbi:HAD family hydrolase [Streptosporangium jomthongense]|uniref:HAD family hydrolase n=1 Tax=Streptosporangium jomthongense TaxID=1193683 RepID=A0ABV8F2S5_9ACTN